jgi:hypothetical protein
MSLEPTLAEIFADHREDILRELHICLPGRVKTYDAAKQTADVVPCVRGTIPDSEGNTLHEELPVIPNVPVGWMRGGGYYLHMPLAVGDHVWLVFNEASIAQWRATGEVSDPGDLSRGSLSYPWAYPGAAPNSKAFSDAPAAGEAVFGAPGLLRVGGPSAAFVSLAPKVDADHSALKAILQTLATTLTGAAVEPACATAGAALTAALGSWPNPAGTAATKLKAQ